MLGEQEVWGLTMPRPHHDCVLVAQLRNGRDGSVHVVVGDVAEDPTEQDQIGWDGSDVRVAGPRIGAPDLDVAETQSIFELMSVITPPAAAPGDYSALAGLSLASER